APLLFPNPARGGLPSYQTVAEPWHSRAVTRPRIGHLRADLFSARSLTRSTLLRRQCHAVVFQVTCARFDARGRVPGLSLPAALPWRFLSGAVQRQTLDSIGGRTRTRTWDPLIKSQLLYQLSYAPEVPPR